MNDELRFALRSIAANVPHGRIWVVGYQPPWVKNVEYVPGGNSAPHMRANLYRNLWLACREPDMSDEVLIFNDDIYVVGPVPHIPVMYRGWLSSQVKLVTRRAGPRGWWPESLIATQTALVAAGHDNPISYELHVPFACNRHKMAAVLERFAGVTPHNPPQWRTLYGNVEQIGGIQHPDGKSVRPGPISRPYHSTDDMSWRYYRARFIQLFPERSPYERPVPDARSLVSVSPRNHLRSTRRVVRA